MKNKILSKQEIVAIKIADLLFLIARCDAMINSMLANGIDNRDIQIRQEVLIKHRYCEEMNQIFKSLSANIHIVEDELRQAA